MAKKRGLWGTRFGFYLAAIGSAFGLGNLWRFPYVVVENGGGAFVLLYIFLALLIGLPMLLGELMLGKLTRRSGLSAISRLVKDSTLNPKPLAAEKSPRRSFFYWAGPLSVFTCLLVLSYYAVISGWVLHFLMQFLSMHIETGTFDAEKTMMVLRDNGPLQIALTSVHLLIAIIVVVKGVQEGIEKWVGNMMPVFVLLLVVLVINSLSLSTATPAMRFLFYPDFSRLTMSSFLHALGHVFFTLSIGFGTMITFGSYLNEHTHIPSAGFRVTTMDTVISLFAGLLIFPIVVGASTQVAGPEILFQTVPKLILRLDGGFFIGMAFFTCLYLAALGASIGILESIVANAMDFLHLDRARATWLSGVAAFLLAIVPALSTSVLKDFQFQGSNLLETLDNVLINGLLPVSALFILMVISLRLKSDVIRSEFVNDESIATEKLFSHWKFVVRWIAPLVIVSAMILAIAAIFMRI